MSDSKIRYTVAALIINWNGAADTIDLLKSLRTTRPPDVDLTVVIVDNGSEREDRARLEAYLASVDGVGKVSLCTNAVNVGVPAAYNQAIQVAGPDYDFYLRLDNDVLLAQDGLTRLIAAMNETRSENVGLVGGNVKYWARPEEDNGGAVTINLVQGRTAVSYPAEDTFCDGVLGCIMLIHRAVVQRYAPLVFDPTLFVTVDESELSLRAAEAGMKTLYVSRTIGFHKGGVSTGKVPFLSRYYSARNWTLVRSRFLGSSRDRLRLFMSVAFWWWVSLLRGRWAYCLGSMSGALKASANGIDRRVRRLKRTQLVE